MNKFQWNKKLVLNTRKLILLSSILLVTIAIGLELQTSITSTQLYVVFQFAGLCGIICALYSFVTAYKNIFIRVLYLVIAYLIWRISYFPIMVLAGFIATLGERVFTFVGVLGVWVYPVFVLAIAAMNFLAIFVSLYLFSLLVRRFRSPENKTRKISTVWNGILSGLSFPILAIAIAVSFSHPSDWHTIADTSYIDKKPLPNPYLPDFNPYWAASSDQSISLSQKILFTAAAVTYDLAPNTSWSRVVKGTLEYEFTQSKEITTSFCTKIHYRAFIVAHPYLGRGKNKVTPVTPY